MIFELKINKGVLLFMLLCIISFFISCKKYLDEKPIKSQVVPSNLIDLQALLDFHDKMNEASPTLQDLASDDYYLTDDAFLSRVENDRLNHIWDKNAVYPESWVNPYQRPIYYSNLVISQLSSIIQNQNNLSSYNAIKGSALFFRAFNYQRLTDLYCKPFSASAATDPGLILRLNTEIEAPAFRSSVKDTYDQIIKDLKEAATLLPSTSLFPTRPIKAAAYGTLARTYLTMRDYNNAGIYADKCLQEYNTLIDYNSLIPVPDPPFVRFNKETIFYNHVASTSTLANYRAIIDTNLYKSYAENDLRKKIFFIEIEDGKYGFQGGYDGTYSSYVSFDGITTDEMFLIRSECFARNEKIELALKDLNTLMEKRFLQGTFVSYTASTPSQALKKILDERRKELLYRGLRWSDLRRLNLEGANITLKRVIEGVEYTLPPNDPRWIMLIPQETTNYTNISQNPR